MNPVLAAMRAHRTIRSYAPDPVDEADVRAVVDAARRAATSSNVQGYALLRIRATATRERLAHLTGDQPQVRTAGAFFVVCADQRRHRLVAEKCGRALAPNLESFLVDTIDAALFAQNLALGFESLGLGTCFIGGLRTRLPEVDELLAIPADVFPLFGLCVGAAADDPGARPRLPLDSILFDERVPSDAELREHIDAYDARMGEYYAGRGKPGHNWSGGVARKLERPQREHLHAYYTEKGARLS